MACSDKYTYASSSSLPLLLLRGHATGEQKDVGNENQVAVGVFDVMSPLVWDSNPAWEENGAHLPHLHGIDTKTKDFQLYEFICKSYSTEYRESHYWARKCLIKVSSSGKCLKASEWTGLTDQGHITAEKCDEQVAYQVSKPF